MTGRGVRPGTALLVALGVGGASWLLWQLTTGEGDLVPRPSWLAATLLVAMAAFEVVVATTTPPEKPRLIPTVCDLANGRDV